MRSARILGVPIDADGSGEIAQRSRGTPRVANRLLRRVRDFAQVRAGGAITGAVAKDALALLEVDAHGFDDVDRRLLLTIIQKFGGGPVGVNALAAAISEEPEAIEDIYEPYLLQHGFLDRTPRGRTATRARLRAPRAPAADRAAPRRRRSSSDGGRPARQSSPRRPPDNPDARHRRVRLRAAARADRTGAARRAGRLAAARARARERAASRTTASTSCPSCCGPTTSSSSTAAASSRRDCWARGRAAAPPSCCWSADADPSCGRRCCGRRRRLRPGTIVDDRARLPRPRRRRPGARAAPRRDAGHAATRLVRLLADAAEPSVLIERHGHVPLPPYIRRPDRPADRERYQTVFAREAGSRRGAHGRPALHARPARTARGPRDRHGERRAPRRPRHLPARRGRRRAGTPRPRRALHDPRRDRVRDRARRARAGRRVVAVGTTTTRALESRTDARRPRAPGRRRDGPRDRARASASERSTRWSRTSTCRARRCCSSSAPSPAASACSPPTGRPWPRATASTPTATPCYGLTTRPTRQHGRSGRRLPTPGGIDCQFAHRPRAGVRDAVRQPRRPTRHGLTAALTRRSSARYRSDPPCHFRSSRPANAASTP